MPGTSLARQFLIAMPAMLDPHFARGVTFVCQHDDDGAMGLMVNRPLELRVRDVLGQMGISTEREAFANAPVYFGGPVQTERGFVLHVPPGSYSSTLSITSEISLTTSKDVLEAVAEGGGPEKMLVTLGYSGWSAGQLESEIAQNAWLTVKARPEIIFDMPADEKYEAALKLLGVDTLQLSGQAGHA